MKLPDDDLRMLSVIQYKIGLSYYMDQSFDESIGAFKKACEILDCRIETAKSKDDKSEKDISAITELEEMKEEILAKIAEIEEVKQQVRIVLFFCGLDKWCLTEIFVISRTKM